MPTARPASIDEIIPQYFPFSNYRKIGKGTKLDVLIAGCGTGLHSLKFAQIFPDAKILAIDLSMPSLCYAKEKTRKMGFDNIEYAQADILEIGRIDRRFDVISSSGVLHHLANPEQGWSTLLSLLRPGGCMNIGLYSERARRNLVIAQRWLVERGFTPSVEDIRRARQELIARANTNKSMDDVRKFADFYSTSECRDLLFHTQEHRYTIPAIHDFLEKNNLEFLQFMIGNEIFDQSANNSPNERKVILISGIALKLNSLIHLKQCMSFGCRKGTVTSDEPKATPRHHEARLAGFCELFRFRRTDQAVLLRSRIARARAEIRRCRAGLQARAGDRRRSCRGVQQSRPGSSGARQDERRVRLLRPFARAHAAIAGTIRGYLCNAIFIAARAGGSAPPPGRRMAAAPVFERSVR